MRLLLLKNYQPKILCQRDTLCGGKFCSSTPLRKDWDIECGAGPETKRSPTQ